MIDAVAAVHPMTPLVHMTGWSNGCMMTQRFMAVRRFLHPLCMAGYLMTDAPSTYTAPIPPWPANVLYADGDVFQNDAREQGRITT